MTPHSHTVVAMDPSSLTVSLLSGDSSVKSVKSFKSFNTSEGSVRRTSLSIDQQSDYPRLETSIPSGLMIHPSIKITAENSPRELLVGPRDLWLVYRLAVSDGTLGIAKEEAGKVMSLESLIDIKAFSREGLASAFEVLRQGHKRVSWSESRGAIFSTSGRNNPGWNGSEYCGSTLQAKSACSTRR